MADKTKPEVVRLYSFSIQVCVPKEYSDEQIVDFAEREYPCGTEAGWHIRRQGDPLLQGADERVVCQQNPEKVHVMLDA